MRILLYIIIFRYTQQAKSKHNHLHNWFSFLIMLSKSSFFLYKPMATPPDSPLLFSSLLILIPKIRLVGCFVIFIFGCKTYQDYQITLQTLLLLLPKQCTSIPLFPSLSSFKITNCGFVIFSFCLFRWMVDDWMLH